MTVKTDGWAHIYAQRIWHSPATIMGDREALKRIRDSIDRALATGMEQHAKLWAADGEGYECNVVIRSYESLQSKPLPYSDEMANPKMKQVNK